MGYESLGLLGDQRARAARSAISRPSTVPSEPRRELRIHCSESIARVQSPESGLGVWSHGSGGSEPCGRRGVSIMGR